MNGIFEFAMLLAVTAALAASAVIFSANETDNRVADNGPVTLESEQPADPEVDG